MGKLNYIAFIVHSEPKPGGGNSFIERNIFSAKKREKGSRNASIPRLNDDPRCHGFRKPFKRCTVISCNGYAGTIRYISTVLRTAFVSSSTTTLSLQRQALRDIVVSTVRDRHHASYNNIRCTCHRSHGKLFPSIVNSSLSYRLYEVSWDAWPTFPFAKTWSNLKESLRDEDIETCLGWSVRRFNLRERKSRKVGE